MPSVSSALSTLTTLSKHILARNIEQELFVACRRYGLDIVVYNPIAGGLFSGKYTSASLEQTPTEGRFSDTAGSGAMYRKRYFRNSTFEAIAHISDAVLKAGLTMPETALRWCVWHSKLNVGGIDYSKVDQKDKKGNDGIIIGVSSQKQLEGNLKDLEKGRKFMLYSSVVERIPS
jgi:aflatoxin B1 aldehyde reductase